MLRARNIFECARQHHGVAAGINQRCEVDQQFRPSLDVPTALNVADLPLHVGPRGNQDPVVLRDGERPSIA